MTRSAAQVGPPGRGPINAGRDSEPSLAADMGSEEPPAASADADRSIPPPTNPRPTPPSGHRTMTTNTSNGVGSDEVIEQFLSRAMKGDARGGTRFVLDLLDRGVPSGEVIVDLLGAAQRRVGERWVANAYTVADEHVISGVVQRALDAMADALEPPPAQGLVAVACAEGEWHSLPAQMFAELLRIRGFTVTFLGASTPVEHVARLLTRQSPDAVAISCHLPLHFAGVTRLADAAHAQGIPVLAGGQALSHHPTRARRLRADACPAGIDDADAVLRAWQHDKPTALDPWMPDSAVGTLDLEAPSIAAEAFDTLLTTYPSVSDYTDAQLARTREDLAYITRFVAAASLVGDPSVLTDFLHWLLTLLSARGVPANAVHAGLAALAPIIDRTHPPSGELTRTALRSLTD